MKIAFIFSENIPLFYSRIFFGKFNLFSDFLYHIFISRCYAQEILIEIYIFFFRKQFSRQRLSFVFPRFPKRSLLLFIQFVSNTLQQFFYVCFIITNKNINCLACIMQKSKVKFELKNFILWFKSI